MHFSNTKSQENHVPGITLFKLSERNRCDDFDENPIFM